MHNRLKLTAQFTGLATLLLWAGFQTPAFAGKNDPAECTVVLDAATSKVLVRKGSCDSRYAPASTFKVPLAVIGFDKGILKSEHDPVWQWKPEFDAPKRDHKAVDPTSWLKDSVLWYSREMTRMMGQEQFSQAIKALDYGNMDVSGDKVKKDGLTHSWLGTSLTISPDEQAKFIGALVNETLPVSKEAQVKTKASMPVFESANGWKVTGKTGSIWLRDDKGEYNKSRPLGWFVGWAEKGDRKVVFARMKVYDKPVNLAAGRMLRDQFLKTFNQ